MSFFVGLGNKADVDFSKFMAYAGKKEAGAIRARTWEDFLDSALALGHMPPLRSENIVMVTNGGGSGLLASDEFERRGIPLRELKDISPELSSGIKAYYKSLNKAVVSEFQGGAECDDAIKKLRDAGIPAYPTPERAVTALVALREYAKIKEEFRAK